MHSVFPIERSADLVERMPSLLQRLDPEQLVEMFGAVVVPASNAERGREEPLLNVVTDRAPRDAAKIRQVADRVAGFLGRTRVI